MQGQHLRGNKRSRNMFQKQCQIHWEVLAVFESVDFSEALQAVTFCNYPGQGSDS